MKFVWLKQGESIVKEEKVRAEFKRYILRGLKRSYELDELADDLTEMDELFVDYNMEWTPEHSEYLKDITRKVLDYIAHIYKEAKQMNYVKELKKSVEHGKNGTQKYVIKEGENKGKIV